MQLKQSERQKRDLIAQWAYDTRPILGRFHLWLEDVDVSWDRGAEIPEFTKKISFMDGRMERLMAMTAAVTALGTRLFGKFGEGSGLDKAGLNQKKKDADAISAYAMSECLWYASRQLPENHALMVSLGEGLMPKAGETPEMGSNPLLGFGRIYARPEIAQLLDKKIEKLLNQSDYDWTDFYNEIKKAGIVVWGMAIDTLENTSRFALGKSTGPMTVLHIFNQPLEFRRPYEGYVGNLILPGKVVEMAARNSLLITFRTPREKIVQAIEQTWPEIKRKNIHVWTLRGKSREKRIGKLWEDWEKLGVHLVEDGWVLPSGIRTFTDSGTYAPTYLVGTWNDSSNEKHLFLCDGYAASAESMQAASLAPMLKLNASMVPFSSKFNQSYDREQHIMGLDPDALDFKSRFESVIGHEASDEEVMQYKTIIKEAMEAGVPVKKNVVYVNDYFPEKKWEILALSGYMCDDPYSGAKGVQKIDDIHYKTTVRLSTPVGEKKTVFTFRLMESAEQERLVFNPLLIRFFYGEDFTSRAVKISDSGRIRNELQTLCSEALEHNGRKIKVIFNKILPEVVSNEHLKILKKVIKWYKQNHPIWFDWLEFEDN